MQKSEWVLPIIYNHHERSHQYRMEKYTHIPLFEEAMKQLTGYQELLWYAVYLTAVSILNNKITGADEIQIIGKNTGQIMEQKIQAGEGQQSLKRLMAENLAVLQNMDGNTASLDNTGSRANRKCAILFQKDASYDVVQNYALVIAVGKKQDKWYYDNKFYNKSMIKRYQSCLEDVLEALLVPEERCVADVTVSQQEHWYEAGVVTDLAGRFQNGKYGICARIDRIAASYPDYRAVIGRKRSCSYREFQSAGSNLACQLQQEGVKAGDYVGVYCTQDMLVPLSVYALAKLGAVYVPIDYTTPRARAAFLLRDSRVKLLIHPKGSQPPQFDDVQMLEAVMDLSDRGKCLENTEGNFTAYKIYTSGTTGKPKGIEIDQYSLLNLCDWYSDTYEINSHSKLMLMNNFNFDASVKNIYTPLLTGASIVLTVNELYNTYELLDTIAKKGVTHINCVPSLCYALLDTARHERYQALSGIQYTILGGEVFNPRMLRKWAGTDQCRSRFSNVYGPAECTSVSSYYIVSKEEIMKETAVPIGRPVSNKWIYVLNENGKKCPPLVKGMICIGGVGIADGYAGTNRSDSVFKQDIYSGDGKMYISGDYGTYREDGELLYQGRRDNQIKIRGQRIELEELEHIVKKHGALEECVIKMWTKELQPSRIVAYCLRKAEDKGTDLDISRIRERLMGWLPGAFMPHDFVEVETFPLSGNGKINRDALEQPAALHSREKLQPADMTALQKGIAKAWKETLGIAEIPMDCNFFELGGTSLLLYKLKAEIETYTGAEVDITGLLNYTTVSASAKWLAKSGRMAEDSGTAEGTQTDRQIVVRRSQAVKRRQHLYNQYRRKGEAENG